MPITKAGLADRIEHLVHRTLGTTLPVGVRAWDGSFAGPEHGPLVVIRSSRALRHLVWQPGELGLARAYVSGDLDVEGDLAEALRRCWRLVREHDAHAPRLGPRAINELLKLTTRMGAIGPPPGRLASEARVRGGRHSRHRDRDAIAHHYDGGNAFYELLLDSHMAYSCGYWRHDRGTLEQAQEAKLELICAKLGLRPGMRLLDVGCGWGSLVLHAARRHGVHATGITLSGAQRDHVCRRVELLGLDDRVQVRLQDYRDVDVGAFDAIATVEMGEHVGARNYIGYAKMLHRNLRPGGRLLVQQMSRGADAAPGGGPFIQSYIAPDMSMVPLSTTLRHLENVGLETQDVQAMREHYVRTANAWARTLDTRAGEAARLVGAEQVRVWRLYLAGGALAFEQNRMGVHQILAVRPYEHRHSGMPPAVRELTG